MLTGRMVLAVLSFLLLCAVSDQVDQNQDAVLFHQIGYANNMFQQASYLVDEGALADAAARIHDARNTAGPVAFGVAMALARLREGNAVAAHERLNTLRKQHQKSRVLEMLSRDFVVAEAGYTGGAAEKETTTNWVGQVTEHDEMGVMISCAVELLQPKTVLDIGSSTGQGTMTVLINALTHLVSNFGSSHRLFGIEASEARFQRLVELTSKYPFVEVVHGPSVVASEMPQDRDFLSFYFNVWTSLNAYGLDNLFSWLYRDRDFAASAHQGKIDDIKRRHDIEAFDLVVVDGSEFTGLADTKHVLGSSLIILDDVFAFKTFAADRFLSTHANYTRVFRGTSRQGFSAFASTSLSPHVFAERLALCVEKNKRETSVH